MSSYVVKFSASSSSVVVVSDAIKTSLRCRRELFVRDFSFEIKLGSVILQFGHLALMRGLGLRSYGAKTIGSASCGGSAVRFELRTTQLRQ